MTEGEAVTQGIIDRVTGIGRLYGMKNNENQRQLQDNDPQYWL
jgi:hypothetical protein